MAKVIVFGAGGQLGKALQKLLPHVSFYTREDCDVTSVIEVAEIFTQNLDVEFVINASGYTKVDQAEVEPDQAYLVNTTAVEIIAQIAQEAYTHQAILIHISTDYVFDGTATEPYKPDAPTNPTSVYGKSKLYGEIAVRDNSEHYIVRTSWLYGNGPNFVRTMFLLGTSRDEVRVVNDQFGLPTNALDLAEFCCYLMKYKPQFGTYHFCNGGDPISWAYLAETIFSLMSIKCTVVPVSTEEYLLANPHIIAPRPQYSALDYSGSVIIDDKSNKKSFYVRGWYAALSDYLDKQAST
ncbi:dTDP-4-dehydrorhamnose reductase [Candidatus Saccharibacteria bacterium]|nr:dTDP-4-dehydrorhamnose reductase [Candidatus Saccharibacteria bacterium]